MKAVFLSVPIISLFLAACASTPTQKSESQEYIFSVSRIYSFITSQKTMDTACKKKLSENEYDTNAYQSWSTNNKAVISETEIHFSALPKLLAALHSTTAEGEERALHSKLLTAATPLETIIHDANAEDARKLCAVISYGLNKGLPDLETAYAKELISIRKGAR